MVGKSGFRVFSLQRQLRTDSGSCAYVLRRRIHLHRCCCFVLTIFSTSFSFCKVSEWNATWIVHKYERTTFYIYVCARVIRLRSAVHAAVQWALHEDPCTVVKVREDGVYIRVKCIFISIKNFLWNSACTTIYAKSYLSFQSSEFSRMCNVYSLECIYVLYSCENSLFWKPKYDFVRARTWCDVKVWNGDDCID